MVKKDNRDLEQLRRHYEIEKKLAGKLRAANKEQRKKLYGEVYDIFFKELPDLPQLQIKPQERQRQIDYLFRELKPYLTASAIYLEVGAGDCKLALQIADFVKKVLVIEASDELVKKIKTPNNFELIVADSTEIAVADNSVDLVFSNQVMEHLHPEDAIEQQQNIYRILKPGGRYICLTPNRLSGPHDISKYFDEVPAGFHLKEYLISELYSLLKNTGFSRVHAFARIKNYRIFIPFIFYKTAERILEMLSYKTRRKITSNIMIHIFLGINIIAVK